MHSWFTASSYSFLKTLVSTYRRSTTHLLLYCQYTSSMPSQSKGKSSKTPSVIERPAINWKENTHDGSLILSVVKEAATLAPIAELKKAACSALLIFKTTQVSTRKNNRSYHPTCPGLSFTSYRSLRKTKRHTNDLASILAGLSLPFGARLRRRKIRRNGYPQKCEIFLKTYRSMIDHPSWFPKKF